MFGVIHAENNQRQLDVDGCLPVQNYQSQISMQLSSPL